jgi:hypothetical protein
MSSHDQIVADVARRLEALDEHLAFHIATLKARLITGTEGGIDPADNGHASVVWTGDHGRTIWITTTLSSSESRWHFAVAIATLRLLVDDPEAGAETIDDHAHMSVMHTVPLEGPVHLSPIYAAHIVHAAQRLLEGPPAPRRPQKRRKPRRKR